MKYLLILLFSSSLLFSQERFIKGYVYFEEDFIPISEVEIFDSNNKLITETNTNGYFNFKLNGYNKTFFLKYPGLQKEQVNLKVKSDLVYVFMITHSSIDFVSLKKSKENN